MIERHHLDLIRAVEQQGSLTAAAEKLCLSQSALSHSARKLEQQMGAAVWIREGRRLRLTQAGQLLLSLANRLLPQFEHAEEMVRRMARGQKGMLRIGMECHPCYQWLLKVVGPFLQQWPDVDVDVKQQFQFGGMAALFGHDIDLLVTPDPLYRKGLIFEPVFDYELRLVVSPGHLLAGKDNAQPRDLEQETLITYPVETERLDIFSYFLLPAGCRPARHKTIETTEILLQMVSAGRGISALPGWLADEYRERIPVETVRLGEGGVHKQIWLGMRESDRHVDYLRAFVQLASSLSDLSNRCEQGGKASSDFLDFEAHSGSMQRKSREI